LTYLEKYLSEHSFDKDRSIEEIKTEIINESCPEPRQPGCDGNCVACWNTECGVDISEEKSESDKWICKDCIYLAWSRGDYNFVCGRGEHKIPCENTVTCENYSSITPVPCKENPQVLHKSGSEPFGIKDSGARREFKTGAVRDIQEGKGRCDLLPLDVVAHLRGNVLHRVSEYQDTGEFRHLCNALQQFIDKHYNKDMSTAFLEVSKHFEEGAKKYGEYNWQKGIPTHCYIDSAVRHYLKYLRGDKDEPHDRAFVWNILCCIWTCIHKPELNDYKKIERGEV
jgi:hypothetical protein